jgi:hypothetical protein
MPAFVASVKSEAIASGRATEETAAYCTNGCKACGMVHLVEAGSLTTNRNTSDQIGDIRYRTT